MQNILIMYENSKYLLRNEEKQGSTSFACLKTLTFHTPLDIFQKNEANRKKGFKDNVVHV